VIILSVMLMFHADRPTSLSLVLLTHQTMQVAFSKVVISRRLTVQVFEGNTQVMLAWT